MAWNQRWGGSVIGQDKVNKATQGTARTFSANPFGFSHGQRTVREVLRGTPRPAPSSQQIHTSERAAGATFRLLCEQVIWLAVGAILIMLLAAATRTDGLIFVATDSSCPIGIYHVVHQPSRTRRTGRSMPARGDRELWNGPRIPCFRRMSEWRGAGYQSHRRAGRRPRRSIAGRDSRERHRIAAEFNAFARYSRTSGTNSAARELRNHGR